jgi:RND family efflux transporter MFP subunit
VTGAEAFRFDSLELLMKTQHGLWLFSAVLFAAIAVAHDGHRPLPARGMEINAEKGLMVLTAQARSALDVETAEVSQHVITQAIFMSGSIVPEWDRHALVSSPLHGRIVELFAGPGDPVQSGQIVAHLDSPELESLQLELRTAQTAIDLALKLQASAEAAAASGAIPELRALEARTQVQLHRTAVEIASAKWLSLQLPQEELQALLEAPGRRRPQKLALRSPISGTVMHSDLSVGKIVTSGEHLLELVDLTSVRLKIDVLEKDLPRVVVGNTLELRLTTHPNRTFTGTVDALGHLLDPQSHTGTAWASFSNPTQQSPLLRPGMSGQVKVTVGGATPVTAVPISAVIRDGAERFVLVEEEQTQLASTYRKQSLSLGDRVGAFIQVRGGNLFPGDRVVTRGSHQLGSFFASGVLRVTDETARDIGLEVQPVSRVALSETLTIDGQVDLPPTRRTVASSQLEGTITRLLVDRGQAVMSGQVIAEIVSQDFQNLQMELLQALLEMRLQQQVLSNLDAAEDAILKRRLWEANSQLQLADSRLQSLRERLTTAGLSSAQITQLESTRQLLPTLPILAPISGTVVDFRKTLGGIVQPDEPVFEIHDPSFVRIVGYVPERDIAEVQNGQVARVRLVADAKTVLTGTVVRTGGSIGAQDRTMPVWIEFRTPTSVSVQNNMLARITVELRKRPMQLAVPHSAVLREGLRSFVFVEQEDRVFARRPVLLGNRDDTSIAVLQGLAEGERIAVGGVSGLQSGFAALR